MPGRPRKPAAIREAEGNRSRTPIPKEPDYPAGAPDKPPLSAAASGVWDELVGQMIGSGVLRKTDKRALAQLCENESIVSELYSAIWATLRNVKKSAKESGLPLPSNAMGVLATSDEGRKLLLSVREMAKITNIERQQFGLTPSSRTKVGATELESALDDWETAQCADTGIPTRTLQ